MEGESPRSSSSDRSGPGSGESSSPIHGFVQAFGTALTSTAAASATATIAAGRRLTPGGGRVRGERFEDMMTARLDDLARMVGEVADRVLKYVSDRMPGLEACAISTMDTIFAPRLVLRHLMVAVALQAGLLTYNGLVAAANELLSRMSKRHEEARIFREKMRDAKNYEEWKMHAEQLDHLEGHDEWRKRPDSLLYNHKVLQEKINDLNTMINAEDVFGLIFRLRGSLSRNQHGMLHEGLFTRAHAGTKVLVEQYHGVVCDALHYVCTKNAMAQDIPTDVKLAFFNETRHAYGRTALMLSGGASMGVYHAGVIKALWERRLLPRVVSGASAGSIVAAMVGTRTDAELDPMFSGKDVNLNFFCPLRSSTRRGGRRTSKVKNQAFWQLLVPPGLRWMATRLSNVLLYHDGFLRMDSDYFRRVVRYNVGPSTFQEAFDRTGRIVNITVAPQNRTDPPRLLNYLTAPHVLVWSAAVCSSSVPGVFEPSYLLVKDADGSIHPEYETIEKFVDGSMEADLPMQQISELFNINHFIVSQANPHASILSTMALSKSVWCPPMYGFLVGLVGFLQAQVRCWFRNVIEFVSRRRVAPEWASKRGGIQLLTQEYEGRHCDVTISPWKGKENVFSSFAKLLRNVSTTEFLEMTRVAERNTWPKMEMIRSHCAVEMELEQCVQAMRRQLTTEHQARIHPSSEDMKRYGRVPSFYTSRSLVNLSGLSVTDPSIARDSSSLAQGDGSYATIGAPSNRVSLRLQPMLSEVKEGSGASAGRSMQDVHHGTSVDRGSARYVRANIVPAFGGMVNADIANGDIANDGITSGNIANGHGSVETQGPVGSQGFTGERRGFDFRTLPPLFSQSPPVSGGSPEQSQHQQRAAAGSVTAESSDDARLDGKSASNSSGNVDLGMLSPEQLVALGIAREEDVVKSTTMANFYYRRSRSLENEMNIIRQINISSGNLSSRSEPCSRSDSRCESRHRGDDDGALPGPSAS